MGSLDIVRLHKSVGISHALFKRGEEDDCVALLYQPALLRLLFDGVVETFAAELAAYDHVEDT